jgi:hypothetical protein
MAMVFSLFNYYTTPTPGRPAPRPGLLQLRGHIIYARIWPYFSKEFIMSGHSKWASIKHKKAATDAKRGKVFTKIIRRPFWTPRP